MEVPKCSKIVEFPKIFIKMKNCKTFYEAQTASHLKEIIRLSPNLPTPDKILLLLWNKNFLTEIYRNIQTFAFKVLQECSSWASRNGAVQMFFLTPNRNMFAEKFLRFFGRNCIVKWVIFFASFCWLWDFLLENLKLKRNSEDVRWNIWANIKKLYARNNIFKKRIPNMTFWIIYIWSKFLFWGLL